MVQANPEHLLSNYWSIPVAGSEGMTLQNAVGRPLGVKLVAHPNLRNCANTLLNALTKAKAITINKEPIAFSVKNTARLLIPKQAAVAIFNAVLLNGVFGAPKLVVGLFTGSSSRTEYADYARGVLVERQSVAGLGLVRPELIRFIDMLGSNCVDLREERLPNPFADSLPQMGIGPAAAAGSLLSLLATQSASLSLGDSMMAHYFDGRFEQAHLAALEIQTENPVLLKYRDLIVREYEEAKAFGDLLEAWR